jgi:putative transposase
MRRNLNEVFSIPGKPRGRGRIERFFSTVNGMFLSELDGYAPSGCGVRGKPVLTLAELDAKFRTFLLDVYHRRDNAETENEHASIRGDDPPADGG